MLSDTSTEWAPWYVIPADRKWFARICASAVLAHTLIEIDPRYPGGAEASRCRGERARGRGAQGRRPGPFEADWRRTRAQG